MNESRQFYVSESKPNTGQVVRVPAMASALSAFPDATGTNRMIVEAAKAGIIGIKQAIDALAKSAFYPKRTHAAQQKNPLTQHKNLCVANKMAISCIALPS